jgi:hypothetical protein
MCCLAMLAIWASVRTASDVACHHESCAKWFVCKEEAEPESGWFLFTSLRDQGVHDITAAHDT